MVKKVSRFSRNKNKLYWFKFFISLLLINAALFYSFVTFYLHFENSIKILQILAHRKLLAATLSKPFYRTKMHTFDCYSNDTVNGTVNYMQLNPLKTVKRIDLWHIFSNCTEVRNRFYYPNVPLTLEEAEFPIAFAINIDKQLEVVELLLSAIYMPQNVYCFHVDLKAPFYFHDAMFRYSKCFDNVFIAPEKFPVLHSGYGTIPGYMACLKALVNFSTEWRYAAVLQNNDFPLRTNLELVKILKILNGSNDVELSISPGFRYKWHHYISLDKDGLPSGVHKTESKKGPPPGNMKIYKGGTAATLSRAFVSKIVSSKVVDDFVEWLRDGDFTDELFWSTLNHAETFAAPGGYPGSCIYKGSFLYFLN